MFTTSNPDHRPTFPAQSTAYYTEFFSLRLFFSTLYWGRSPVSRLPIHHLALLPVIHLPALHHDQNRAPHGRRVTAHLDQRVDQLPLAHFLVDCDLPLDVAFHLRRPKPEDEETAERSQCQG